MKLSYARLITLCMIITGSAQTLYLSAFAKPDDRAPRRSNSPELNLSKIKNFVRVPLTRQSTDYTCGVAALQSVLAYYGEDVREGQLAHACKSNAIKGTRYGQIADYAKSRGYNVSVKQNCGLGELETLLNRGFPVICLIQAWPITPVDFAKDWDDGHYVVAVGYDSQRVYFMDPSTIGNYTFIPKTEFLTRWHDRETPAKKLNHFAMVISKPKAVYDPNRITRLE